MHFTIFTAFALKDYKADKTLKDSPPKDRTTLVVFIGLLIDLLGKQRNEQPLLIWRTITFSLHTYSPTLPRPYWPLQRQWFKRSVRLSRDQGADSQGKYELTWSYLIPIIGWWLPCHGGSPSSIQHSVVWRLSGQCFLISSGDKCLMFIHYICNN